MTRFRVRPGSLADLPALRDIYRRASLSNAADEAVLLAHPESLILGEAGVVEGRTRLATLADGLIVGFATTVLADDVLELEDLFVDPIWMRQGVGSDLVYDALSLAERTKVGRVEVTANPHALEFYERLGFIADHRIGTEFGQAAIRMRIAIAPRT